MGILSTTLRFSDTGAGAEADGRGSGSISSSRSWDIVTTPDTSEWEVLNLSPTPKRGQPHPDNPYLRCRNVRINRLSPIFWRYTADYELTDSGRDSEDPQNPTGNPLLQPAVIRFTREDIEEEIDEDEEGNPLVTFNGEPFARLTRPYGYRLITIEKNVSAFNPAEKDEFCYVTNADAFLGYAPGRLLLKGIDGEPVTDGDFTYYRQTATIASRTKGKRTSEARAWWLRVRHQGFRVYTGQDDANGRPIYKHAQVDGDYASEPVMLDSLGFMREDQSTADWFEFPQFPSRSFAAADLL